MTTPRLHSRARRGFALAFALVLGACAGAPARQGLERPAPADRGALAIRFSNEAGEHVHVYLVGARRQWLLGRVEAGARATLRVPEEALAEDQRWMRLAVVAGQAVTTRAADDPRAALTLAQPAAEMLGQRWTFSSRTAAGQLTGMPLPRTRDGRPPPQE